MWFDSWESLLRIVVTATLGYVALIVLLRMSGKRTLSKMNAFDFVITIALGSVFATLAISDAIPLLDGVVALAVLVGLQWVASSLYVRSPKFESVVKGTPDLVFWKGNYLEKVLRRVRITHEEVDAAMRSTNVIDSDEAAVVLETDGSLTVVVIADDELPGPLKSVQVPDSVLRREESEAL